MDQASAGFLSQADRQHLEQSALMRTVKVGVHFGAVGDDQAIGFGYVFVDIGSQAKRRHAFVDNFHGGMNWTTHRSFADAQAIQHLDLPGGRTAAVASHCRNDEWLTARCLYQGH